MQWGRDKRAEGIISRAVSEILAKENILNDVLITVSRIEMSRTREHATVRVTIFPHEKSAEALDELNSNVVGIQHELNSKVRVRPVPKIRFAIDETEEKSQRISRLIDESKED